MEVVRWYGEQVSKAVKDATIAAIDELTAEAAEEAKESHWWRNRSDHLEGEIKSEPAKLVDGKPQGRFGTTMKRGFYGLFLERQTPFLRPAADAVFPKLTERIRARLK